MNKNHITPVHPGKVLVDELKEIGLSQSALAQHIGVLSKTINEICRGKRGVSPLMAFKLARTFGQSPELWIGLQKEWELSQVTESDYDAVGRIKLRA